VTISISHPGVRLHVQLSRWLDLDDAAGIAGRLRRRLGLPGARRQRIRQRAVLGALSGRPAGRLSGRITAITRNRPCIPTIIE